MESKKKLHWLRVSMRRFISVGSLPFIAAPAPTRNLLEKAYLSRPAGYERSMSMRLFPSIAIWININQLVLLEKSHLKF